MGRRFRERIAAAEGVLACQVCSAHLCGVEAIVSKQFHGKHGRAYLVDDVRNVCFGAQEQKLLMTGVHVVRDIMCRGCGKTLGWTYDYAREERERYKISRSVLELATVRCLEFGAR